MQCIGLGALAVLFSIVEQERLFVWHPELSQTGGRVI